MSFPCQVVDFLVDYDATINRPSSHQTGFCSPLFLASREGHLEVVKVLVEKGADPLMQDAAGNTPLMAGS